MRYALSVLDSKRFLPQQWKIRNTFQKRKQNEEKCKIKYIQEFMQR